jgi:hypothetical protein
MLFGPNCSDLEQERVKEILLVQNPTVEGKYLGLPTPEGRMSKEKFKSTKERFVKRFSDSGEKYMSMGAKEVLIKYVPQAIPTYVMDIFKLPLTMCEELTQLIRYFWWGDERGQRKVHWLAWDKLLLPKHCGGLGFRDMRLFNQALLARQAWRLIQHPESLCAQLLKAKYYPNVNLVDTVFSSDASPTWKAVKYGVELLKKGIIWRVGSRSMIQIWRDLWIPRASSQKITLRKGRSRLRWVSQLMTPGRREWDVQTIRSCLYPHDVGVGSQNQALG